MSNQNVKTNQTLSKVQQAKIQNAYKNTSQIYGSGIQNQPVIYRTNLDEFHEEHSMKMTHVFIIAGITFILLSHFQQTEPPFSDFITSA